MAKPRRMHVLIVACLLSAVETAAGWPQGRVLAAALILIIVGGVDNGPCGACVSSRLIWKRCDWGLIAACLSTRPAWPAVRASLGRETTSLARTGASSSPTTPAISTSLSSGRFCLARCAPARNRSRPETTGKQSRLAGSMATRVFRAVLVDRAGEPGVNCGTQLDQLIGGVGCGEFVDPLPGRDSRFRDRNGSVQRRARLSVPPASRRRPGSRLSRIIYIASCRKVSSCPCHSSAASASAHPSVCWPGESKAAFLARAREAVERASNLHERHVLTESSFGSSRGVVAGPHSRPASSGPSWPAP